MRSVALLLCLGMVAAGCGGDDESGDAADPDAPPPEEVLGEATPADGEPVVIGFASDGGGLAIDATSSEESAAAAAEYVNEYLGGIAGRPIELSRCQTEGTPEGATACANQFIEEGAVAVTVGASGVGGELAEPIIEAGIPYVSYLAGSAAELSSPEHAYSIASGIGGIGALASYARDEGLPNIAGVVIDVPAATAVFSAFTGVFEAAEVEFTPVPVPPGTADMTSQISANSDADIFFVLGDAAFCTAALQAIGTVAPDTTVISNQDCIDETVAEAVPDVVDGSLVVTTANLNPDGGNDEFETYRAVLGEYASDTAPDGTAADGYSVVLGLARMLDGIEGEITAGTVDAQISASEGALLPLSQEQITISCGEPAVAFLPAVCTTGVFITTLTAEGLPTEYEFVDPADLFEQM